MNGLKSLICLLVITADVLTLGLHTGANHSQPQPNPTLMNTCLITTNVGQLVNFYESVLGIKAQRSGDQYAEFRTGVVAGGETEALLVPASGEPVIQYPGGRH